MPAVIDVGSHTARLLIAEMLDGELNVIHYEHVITHLGEGASFAYGLTSQAMVRTLSVLESFARTIRDLDHTSVRVIGTQVLRVAVNHQ